jgi:hypothetical protein
MANKNQKSTFHFQTFGKDVVVEADGLQGALDQYLTLLLGPPKQEERKR